jgi:dTDP-4-amino-4,6-dideoxygalactose transaminase
MPATPSQSESAQAQPAMQVPLLDLKPQYRPLAAEIQAAIEKVCASQGFIVGPAVKELEASVAADSQCKWAGR